MTAGTDLLPLPWIERYAVVGDLTCPVSDPDGDYVAHDDHAAAMQAYARACVSSATEALRAEVERLTALTGGVEVQRDANWQAYSYEKARAERLAEALREIAASAEEATTGDGHAECASIARAALEQETTNG